MSNPIISVIMPAYNAEKYVALAIESILNQTFSDFEFIIINDASTDRTWEIIQEYAKKDDRVVAIKNETNLKTSKALNVGLLIAKGKYVVRMDADDWSYPDRLEKQCEFMELNPGVVVSGGAIEVCDAKMNILNQRNYNYDDNSIREKIFRYNQFCHPATIWRRDIIALAGGYNEDISLTQDYDIYFRMGKFGEFANLPNVIHKLRIHNGASSIKTTKEQEMNALFIRLKAQAEYGYIMSWFDKFYLVVQWVSLFAIPARFRFWLFNYFRGS